MPTVSLTASEAAIQLTRYGLSWSPALGEPAVLTYAYRASEPEIMPNGIAGFVRFTPEQIALGERSFALWADVANIVFVRVGSGTEGEAAYSDNATILVGNYTTGPVGVSAFGLYPGDPNPLSAAGDIWHNIASPFNAFIHERGHAFGLQHPGEYDRSDGVPLSYATHAGYIEDSWQYTVMSYFRETETGADWGGAVPRGLMMHDIAAIQRLYGANMTTRTGDTIYGFNSNSGWDYMTLLNPTDPAVFCIWDAGGVDTIDMSGYAQNGFINLAAESFSSVGGLTYNVSIAMGAVIENAIGGSGDDTLLGNDADNVLNGGLGADTLRGGLGDDVMIGGAGNDLYEVDSMGDMIAENPSEGIDAVQAAISYTLAAEVENLTLIGSSNINGTGNALNNTVTGNSGNNTLDGGAGADAMNGGVGDDTYVVDNAGDVTTEAANQGVDTVESSVTRNLTANIENLTLTGAAAIAGYGNILDNVITGNAAANSLYGFDGNDTLDGGVGNDAMFGGMGDDSYIVDNAGDITSEASATGGTDTVFSSVTRNLTANIENLVLTGVAAITGFGNVLSNTITGNSAANLLYGFDGNDVLNGMGGDDTMWGAFGDDTYYVDSAGDITVEGQPLGGVDTVIASVSRNLNANFENMTLAGAATTGYGNILDNVMTGSAIANSLYGFDGNDTLDGRAGADLMFGGNGNDTYFVDDAGDVTSEVSALGGIDTVFSSITRNLSANVENLTLTGVSFISGYGNVLDNVVTGNAVANSLYGFDGADTLFGAGGADTLYGGAGADRLDGGFGIDTLVGGGGADTFVFARPPFLEHDLIQDFVVAEDIIELDAHFFSNIGAALEAAEFQIGAAAAEADDRIIYDPTTGALYFDPDGSGVGAAQAHFATLTAGLALTHTDFIIVGGG